MRTDYPSINDTTICYLERDKFLAEAMGECWHSFEGSITGRDCVKCGAEFWANEIETANKKHNFSTPDGFFKLWEWSQEQEWWTYIGFIGNYTEQNTSEEFLHKDCIINPDRLANAVYDYLKGCECWLRTGGRK